MKKLIAIMLTFVFVMIAVAALMISPAAAKEGEWITTGRPDEDEVYYTPVAGYHYTENGFETISPDYTDMSPYQQARARDPIDLKADNDGKGNSVSLKMTVLEYAYGGPAQNMDQWIAFTVNSQPDAVPGSVEYGEGMIILLRQSESGKAVVQSFYVEKSGKSFSLIPIGTPTIDVPINDQGHETYEFCMKYSDARYTFCINGYEFQSDEYLNGLLDRSCANGAYIGITMQTGYEASPISFAVNEWQGRKPTGDDSAQPQANPNVKAPIADSSTIPYGQPAVLWDSTWRDVKSIQIYGAKYVINSDDSVRINAYATYPYINFEVVPSVSYEAADFPYVVVLTRNCWAYEANVYYSAGPNEGYSNEFSENWDIADFMYGDDWALGCIDLSDYSEDGWYGRIHGLRVEFVFIDEEDGTFDIGFIGAFRSLEEACVYAEQYLLDRGYGLEAPTTIPEDTTEYWTEEWQTEDTTEYRTEQCQTEETTREVEWEPVPPVTYESDLPDTEYVPEPGIEYETYADTLGEDDRKQDHQNRFLGNGLVSELFGNNCRSEIVTSIFVVALVLGTAMVFKKKD